MNPTLIGPVVFVAVFVIAGWVGIASFRSATNARLRGIGDALARHGAEVLSVEPARSILQPSVLRFDLAGHRGRITLRWWGRSAQKLSILIEAAPRSGTWIRSPGKAADGISRLLGFERVVSLGAGQVSVATRMSPAAVQELLAPPEVQRLVLDLVHTTHFAAFVGGGHQIAIGPDGLAVVMITAAMWPFNPELVPGVLERLEALDRVLPRPSSPEVTPLHQSHSQVLSSLVPMITLACLGFILGLPLHYPIRATAVQEMLLIGVVPLLAVLFLLARFRYRGRPNALREFLFTAMGMTVFVPFLTFAVLAAVNVGLDDSPAERHRVHVLDYYKHNSHTVYVEGWDPGVSREKVIVPKSIPVVSPGDTLDVEIRKGALGWAWMPSVVKR